MFGKTTKKEESIRDEIDELREEHEQVLIALNNDKARTEELSKTNADIEKQLSEKTGDLELLREEINTLQKEKEDVEKGAAERYAEIDKEISAKQSELEEARQNIETLKKDFSNALRN